MSEKRKPLNRTTRVKIVAAALLSLFFHSTKSPAETVEYEVTFDAVWSSETHPDDFPGSPHFSGLIGGTHDETISFWEAGGLATEGIESMAESGSTSRLRSEVLAAIDKGGAEFVIQGPGIGRSPNTVRHQFQVSDAFSRVSVVSMIAPSPDWFVGTSGLDLRPKGEWLGQVVYDLLPYDAGTDSGPKYGSPNQDTSPAQAISQLTEFPFDAPTPLGTFTFLRILDYDYNQNGVYDAEDINELSMALRDGNTENKHDVNDDGLVNGDDRLTWLENAAIRPGDSNFDGKFNSGDLVSVFQAGEYEDLTEDNSGWHEGDYDGNGDANSSDLVLALQKGDYEAETVNAVPEPMGASLFVVSFLMLAPYWRSRRRKLAR